MDDTRGFVAALEESHDVDDWDECVLEDFLGADNSTTDYSRHPHGCNDSSDPGNPHDVDQADKIHNPDGAENPRRSARADCT